MECTSVTLMDFSDCLLLNLLRYLDSSSLYHLTKVNKRLETLVLDSCLWRKIDARSGNNCKEKIEYCLERVNKSTSMLCLRGETATMPLLTEMQMDSFPEHLTILALENQNIDQPIISLNNFPRSLVELSFKNSSIANSSYFFKRTFKTMENLKVLVLDGCSLINSSVVMSVSKYSSLEILSFYKCQIENSIPYFSIAAWHGFKKLKVLDVRLSGLGNPFLKSMMRCTNIIAFYFQNMDTSYVLDFKNRQQEVDMGGNKSPVPQVDFAILRSTGNEDTLITDKGTAELKRTFSKNEPYTLPKSFLYTDPYGRCTCGYVDSIKESHGLDYEESKDAHVSIEENFFDNAEPLDRHLDLVDIARDRYHIKEYRVTSKGPRKSKSSKGKGTMDSSQKQPPKKRKRTHDDTFKDYPSSSTSTIFLSPERTKSATQTDSIILERYHTCRRRSCTSASASRSEKDTDEPSTSKFNNESRPENDFSQCSISNTETVECLDDKESSKNDGSMSRDCSIPLKKRKRNENGEEVEKSTIESGERESSIEISWRNDEPSCSSSSVRQTEQNRDEPVKSLKDSGTSGRDSSRCSREDGGKGKKLVKGGKNTDKKDLDSDSDDDQSNFNCECVVPNCSMEFRSKVDCNGKELSATIIPGPSTSKASKCLKCGKDFKDGEKPDTASRGASNDAEEDSDNGTVDPPAPSSPSMDNDDNPGAQPQIGVTFRKSVDENNRNILQICIRGNRDRRSLFVPEVIRMGQGVDFPIVLNAVRMINFMLPPDQQYENPAQNPEVELINLNMNLNKPFRLALKRLSFRGYTRVTDVTLASVEHLNLEVLDLTYTRVTKGGVQAFLRMNPNCRVLHKDFCVCRPNLHF